MKLIEFLEIFNYDINEDHSITIKVWNRDTHTKSDSFNIRDVMNIVSYRNCEIMGVDFSLSGVDIDIYNIEKVVE